MNRKKTNNENLFNYTIHGVPIEQTATLSISIFFFALSPGAHKFHYLILNPLKTDDKWLIYSVLLQLFVAAMETKKQKSKRLN